MIIDKRGKLFGVVSIFDIIAILLILSIVSIVSLTFKKHNVNTKTESVDFVLSTNNTEEFAANAVKIGDLVKDKATGSVIGKVSAVELGESISFTSDSKGKATTSSIPDHVSLKLTVAARGTYTNNGRVIIGKTEYYINALVDARVGLTYIVLRVTELKK